MSLLSAGALGVYRDLTAKSQRIVVSNPAPSPDSGGVVAGATDAVVDGGSATTFGQLLVTQIPSEALLAYTTLLALFSGSGDGYAAGRWVLYALSLLACAVVVASTYVLRRGYDFTDDQPSASGLVTLVRHLPWFPMTASVLSMAVYGLTIPGCALQVSMSGQAFAITAGCLAVGGGFMMSLLAPWLGRGNTAQPTPATD